MLRDKFGRSIRDLRISVTDRCNFRCTYCMPKEEYQNFDFLPKNQILTYEEISVVVRTLIPMGLKKIRITGGEPLLRKDLGKLIKMIRQLNDSIDIAVTTNGVLLSKYAHELAQSGLSRVTVSLDSFSDDLFKKMSDSNYSVNDVLDGINAAIECNLPVKINTVVKKGLNDHEISDLVEYFGPLSIPVRFIEFMDVGTKNEWKIDEVLTGSEMRSLLSKKFGKMERKRDSHLGQVSNDWTFENGWQVGFIESISNPFCSDCNRARLSADGKIYTCLFANKGHDIISVLRMGATDSDLSQAITSIWSQRDDRYSELRDLENPIDKVEMSYIGG